MPRGRSWESHAQIEQRIFQRVVDDLVRSGSVDAGGPGARDREVIVFETERQKLIRESGLVEVYELEIDGEWYQLLAPRD